MTGNVARRFHGYLRSRPFLPSIQNTIQGLDSPETVERVTTPESEINQDHQIGHARVTFLRTTPPNQRESSSEHSLPFIWIDIGKDLRGNEPLERLRP
jgi:hypothetical protein